VGEIVEGSGRHLQRPCESIADKPMFRGALRSIAASSPRADFHECTGDMGNSVADGSPILVHNEGMVARA
jgi:hypothetical protein